MAGFSLAFGSMFSKTWRVHSIFTDVKLNKKVIKDYQLFMVVGVLLCIDVVIMTTWQIADPFYRETKQGEPYVRSSSLLLFLLLNLGYSSRILRTKTKLLSQKTSIALQAKWPYSFPQFMSTKDCLWYLVPFGCCMRLNVILFVDFRGFPSLGNSSRVHTSLKRQQIRGILRLQCGNNVRFGCCCSLGFGGSPRRNVSTYQYVN